MRRNNSRLSRVLDQTREIACSSIQNMLSFEGIRKHTIIWLKHIVRPRALDFKTVLLTVVIRTPSPGLHVASIKLANNALTLFP